MSLPSNVTRVETTFASIWEICLFGMLVAFILVLLFPEKPIDNILLHELPEDEISEQYLQQLLQYTLPKNSQTKALFSYNIMRLDKKKLFDSFTDCLANQNPQTSWLCYALSLSITASMHKNNPQRAPWIAMIKNHLPSVLKGPYRDSQLHALAINMSSLDEPESAFLIYRTLLIKSPNQPSSLYAEAAHAALWMKLYVASAEDYFQAMIRTRSLDAQRRYFEAAVNALLASGDPKNALTRARKYSDRFVNDQSSLVLMAELAEKAGELDLARDYIQRVIQLRIVS